MTARQLDLHHRGAAHRRLPLHDLAEHAPPRPSPPTRTPPASRSGVKFRTTQAGSITGIRFYKGAGNTGTHVGSLW